MGVEIEIFYHSDETVIKKEAGIEYSVMECDTKDMTFYHINCIAPYEDEESGRWFCKIYSGYESFIATKTYEEIKKILHDAGFAG